jgi:hypothetical protein
MRLPSHNALGRIVLVLLVVSAVIQVLVLVLR